MFSIKTGSTGKIRLFFSILSNPWAALEALDVFREEQGKLEAQLVELNQEVAELMIANRKLREELYAAKEGQRCT